MKNTFPNRRWGVFNHFLYSAQNNPTSILNQGKGVQDWNRLVDDFDTERVAFDLHRMGAEYFFLTLMQGTKYMLAPNATYDRIIGAQPGEACSRRDLPLDLARDLAKYDIDLCLYYTGDGPHKDPIAGVRMGYYDVDCPQQPLVTMDFVQNWASVLEEYALRYGDKVKAWWIDGCYTYFGYDQTLLKPYYDACKKGNPEVCVAMNSGVNPDYQKWYCAEEFVCGEFNDFRVLPKSSDIDGARAHILAPLGISADGSEYGGWCRPGCKRDKEYLTDFVRLANRTQTPVTIDIALYADGTWDPEQVELLTYLGAHL